MPLIWRKYEVMHRPSITFINHACLLIKVGDLNILSDPWFFGRVFDNSWGLLQETEIDKWKQTLQQVTHIYISHEHPDHLHFPTLKVLKKILPDNCIVIYKRQSHQNVRNAIVSLGFQFLEVEIGNQVELAHNIRFWLFADAYDTMMLLNYAGTWILNQNDCLLNSKAERGIRELTSAIDIHFVQFSIAGWVGNPDEQRKLESARQNCRNRVLEDSRRLSSKSVVPFASFVEFQTPNNNYLNAYRTRLSELTSLPGLNLQVLFYGDEYLWSNEESRQRTSDNISKYESLMSRSSIIRPEEPNVSKEELIQKSHAWLNNLRSNCFPWLFPLTVRIGLLNDNSHLEFNMLTGKVSILPKTKNLHAEVTPSLLLFLTSQPWGADTLFISGDIRILQGFRFRTLMYSYYTIYRFPKWTRLARQIVAFGGAVIHSIKNK